MKHTSNISVDSIAALNGSKRFFKSGDARLAVVNVGEDVTCIEFMTFDTRRFDTMEVSYYKKFLIEKLKNFEACDKDSFMKDLMKVLERSKSPYYKICTKSMLHYVDNLDLRGTYSCYDYKLDVKTYKDNTIDVMLVDRSKGFHHKVHRFTFKGRNGDGTLIAYKTQ